MDINKNTKTVISNNNSYIFSKNNKKVGVLMKIIGTIVDDNMKLVGCVLKGTPKELNICSDERKVVVEYSIRDT